MTQAQAVVGFYPQHNNCLFEKYYVIKCLLSLTMEKMAKEENVNMVASVSRIYCIIKSNLWVEI